MLQEALEYVGAIEGAEMGSYHTFPNAVFYTVLIGPDTAIPAVTFRKDGEVLTKLFENMTIEQAGRTIYEWFIKAVRNF